MQEYSSTYRVDSKLRPGVVYVLRAVTHGRRRRLEELQAPAVAKIQKLRDESRQLVQEYEAWKKAGSAGEFARTSELRDYWQQIERIQDDEVEPIALTGLVVEIEGLVVDGQPATWDLLRKVGPDAILEELCGEVARGIQLTAEERENLCWPSTLAAQVDGRAVNGTASGAGTPDGTTTADAASTTAAGSARASGTA